MLLNCRENSADLEKGLLLIIFEFEETRSSLVFCQTVDPVDEIDNDVGPRRLGVDSVNAVVRQLSRTSSSEWFLGSALTSLVSSSTLTVSA
jgi:hypothetical protein